MFSYHIFMFPFQWEPESRKEKPFSERFRLNEIKPRLNSGWQNFPAPVNKEYKTEFYNEKNFFYEFVHKALYDSGDDRLPVIRHYERKEAYNGGLEYEIGVKAHGKSNYILKLKSIGLDLFSTGTGVLIFYLENHKYPEIRDVMRINQYGRRIYPPFLTKDNDVGGTKDLEIADYIQIHGLSGEPHRYYEDFSLYTAESSWTAARFITSLIKDFCTDIDPKPVVDDRMFTMCWFLNNEKAAEISDPRRYYKLVRSNEWHEFLYIDSDGSTCQNLRMQKKLLDRQTYPRWQQKGTLYGITRHSFMAISNKDWFAENILLGYFRTIYVRIAELVLVQRASVLKFSAEVTRLSKLDNERNHALADEIEQFYKSYIQFVNQIYFREVTTQEQGIDIYDMLQDSMRIKEQVKDLDNEIEELHNYATLVDEKAQSRDIRLLTILGSLFLIPSFIAGFYGMNLIPDNFREEKGRLLWIVSFLIIFVALGLWWSVKLNSRDKQRKVNILIGVISALIVVSMALALFLLK